MTTVPASLVAATLAAVVGSAPPATTGGEMIFDADAPPTPRCHAPTIAETPSGLIAAWFGGTREKHPDVGIYLSRRIDGVWTPPVRIIDGAERGETETACWNPVLHVPSDGPLTLFYKVGLSPSTWHGMVSTSADDGLTWNEPRRLGSDPALGEPNTALVGPVKNKPVELSDGVLLSPSSSEHDGWRLHFERSADNGETWQVVGPIDSPIPAIQPSILFHRGGRLQAIARTRHVGRLDTTWSDDGGETWSPPELTDVANPNSGTDALTLSDGRHLLVYNPLTLGRHRLAVAVSKDGFKWETVRTLEDSQPGEEFSYPAVIQSADGTIHVTYTWQRQAIKHVQFDPATF